MRPNILQLVYTLIALTSVYAADQDVLTILRQHDELSTFTSYLEQYPDLADSLNNGTFTILAPNNNAFSAFAQNPGLDPSELLPLLQYHLAHDTHPSATFGLSPLFPATLLTNASYTNVTGGQVVELTMINNAPAIVSGIKAQSSIVTPDILYAGGVIHAISSVLTIPISFPATITAAGLKDLIALLDQSGFLKPDSAAVTIANTLADLTLFAPNSPQFGASFTGWDSLDEADLLSILQYSIVQGTVGYSNVLTNNTKYPTLDRASVTVTELNNAIYIDTAKIITRDYLCSNGVLQVLDSPLNPNTTNTRPAAIETSTTSSSKKSGISGAAGAGIGIAIGSVFLGTVIVAALVLRNRRRHGQGMYKLPDMAPSGRPNRRGGIELEADPRGDPRGAPPRYELDNKTPQPQQPQQPQQHDVTYEITPVSAISPSATHAGTSADFTGGPTVHGGWYGHDRSRSGHSAGGGGGGGGGGGRGGGEGGFILRSMTSSPTELNKPPSPLEIDGREKSRISITVNGEAPKHLGFQARY